MSTKKTWIIHKMASTIRHQKQEPNNCDKSKRQHRTTLKADQEGVKLRATTRDNQRSRTMTRLAQTTENKSGLIAPMSHGHGGLEVVGPNVVWRMLANRKRVTAGVILELKGNMEHGPSSHKDDTGLRGAQEVTL